MLCTYCDLPGANLVVAVAISNSGPGWAQHAHASCAAARGVKALDERLPVERDADAAGRPA